MEFASLKTMRIELQLVAFDRGEYAPIPVASAAMGTQLINQLVISHFAIKTLQVTGGEKRPKRGRMHPDEENGVCRIDSQNEPFMVGFPAAGDQSHTMAIHFAEPVRFDVPIG